MSDQINVYYSWPIDDGVMRGFCLAFGVIAAALFFLQVIFLQKMQILPVYLLPLLSISVAYENVLLYCGNVDRQSPSANAGYFFHSIQIPLYLLTFYELTFRLHEARSAKFCCIPFDQSEDVINDWGLVIKHVLLVPLWFIRIVAGGLFVMNILVDFSFVTSEGSSEYAGRSGYITLAQNSSMIPLWLALIPPMTLSAMGFYLAFVLYR